MCIAKTNNIDEISYVIVVNQLSDQLDQTSLTFGSENDILWLRPVSLIELLSLKRQYPGAVLSAGNSSVGKNASIRAYAIIYLMIACFSLSFSVHANFIILAIP